MSSKHCDGDGWIDVGDPMRNERCLGCSNCSDKGLLDSLKEVFTWMERQDLRVGDVWLNAEQVTELNESKHFGWDRVAQKAVAEAYVDSKGAIFRGSLWGARVFESAIVPVKHVAVVPYGIEGRLVSRDACVPL